MKTVLLIGIAVLMIFLIGCTGLNQQPQQAVPQEQQTLEKVTAKAVADTQPQCKSIEVPYETQECKTIQEEYTDQEAYTDYESYTEQEAYKKTVELKYSMQDDAGAGNCGEVFNYKACDKVTITNLDSEAGTFTWKCDIELTESRDPLHVGKKFSDSKSGVIGVSQSGDLTCGPFDVNVDDTLTWKKTVTPGTKEVLDYRTVTKQRPVTKYRTVTKTRPVTNCQTVTKTKAQEVCE